MANAAAPMFAVIRADGQIIARFPTWDDASEFGAANFAFENFTIINLEYDADDVQYWLDNPAALE